MVIRESLVGLRVLLLMLLWHQEKDLLNFFLLCRELHRGSMESIFKVAKELLDGTYYHASA